LNISRLNFYQKFLGLLAKVLGIFAEAVAVGGLTHEASP
jgi:hypothetical protein